VKIDGRRAEVVFARERTRQRKTVKGKRVEVLGWTAPPVGLIEVGDFVDFYRSRGGCALAEIEAVPPRSGKLTGREAGYGETVRIALDEIATVYRPEPRNPLDELLAGLRL